MNTSSPSSSSDNKSSVASSSTSVFDKVPEVDWNGLHVKLNTFYDNEVGKFVQLKNELLQYRLQLDQRNLVINSKKWPEKSVLVQDLTEIDEKIAAFVKRAGLLKEVKQELEDQIVVFRTSQVSPKITEPMSLYNLKGSCDQDLFYLKLKKKSADLHFASGQIDDLYREIVTQINWISGHPREQWAQRIARRDDQDQPTTFTAMYDQSLRHLKDYVPTSLFGGGKKSDSEKKASSNE